MKQLDTFKWARAAARVADIKLGEDILVFDVRKESSVTDCFVLATGTTHLHVRALEDAIREELRSVGAELRRTDGQRGHVWRVLDYGALIIHLMDKKTRDFYAMESLWEKAKKVSWSPAAAARPVKKKPAVRRKKKS